MGRNDILHVPGNAESIKELIAQKKSLVPFIGSGFNVPICPTWSDFLDLFYKEIKDKSLLAEEKHHYLQLKNSKTDRVFEKMSGFLVEKSGRRKFEEKMIAHFDKPLPPRVMPRFHLLHQVFPGLKITTNFDCLVENNSPGPQVSVYYGDLPGELEPLFTHIEQNSLLKIHGGLRDIHSIVLTSPQYEVIYGDPVGFDPKAPLPLFLKRVLTNRSLLFIGCSLVHDRTIMIMESLRDMRLHFAIMLLPGEKHEQEELTGRLSDLGIIPIWVLDFGQIEEILRRLVEPTGEGHSRPPLIEHSVPFVGRVEQLEQIRENLEKESGSGNIQVITGRWFNIEGAGGLGKTTLAIEAAKRFSSLPRFKDGVLAPIRVDKYTPMSFAMYLAGEFQLKVTEPLDPEAAQRLITAVLKERHALLILDNAGDWKSLRYMLPDKTRCTIFITTHNREIIDHIRVQFPGFRLCEIPLQQFTNKEALDLFLLMLGGKYRVAQEDIYLEIARNLGFLPFALGQAVSLMLFGPRYTASGLRDKLASEDRLALLRNEQAAEDGDRLTIESLFELSAPLLTGVLLETLEYLAVCSPGPASLDFLQQLTKDEDIEERLERLCVFSWCECLKTNDWHTYALHPLVRELVRERFKNRFQDNFIQLVHDIFTDDTIHFSIKEKFYLQLEEAFLAVSANRDKRLIDWLYDLYDFCTSCGFIDFYSRLTQWVETLFPEDQYALSAVYAHRALIYRKQGRLEEAMILHKEEEKVCEELGHQAGLARSYGSQAMILKAWGKSPKAMVLHKKEEKIWEDLVHRAGLAFSYGSQAMIFYDWGKLPEAMDLSKKAAEIFEELGHRPGLASCYANQAMILKTEKKFKEAMNLYKKAAKIFEELGRPAQLARSYGNQAMIFYDWGKLPEAMDLNKKEEKMCEELGDRVGLARSYGNQGLILKAQGKLPEAMALHKKEEKMCEAMGDRAGLARSYGNQGLIFKAQGKSDEAMTLFKEQEKISEELSDRAGLALSYGNQATILKALGRFQEAMDLYKKVEEILEELGDRVQLTLSYGNQALILPDWGELQEAMALHKKQDKNAEK
jgi:tetratricopeptide (TPR) repeat protein